MVSEDHGLQWLMILKKGHNSIAKVPSIPSSHSLLGWSKFPLSAFIVYVLKWHFYGFCQVVNELTFYSDDPSLNHPSDIFCKLFEKTGY